MPTIKNKVQKIEKMLIKPEIEPYLVTINVVRDDGTKTSPTEDEINVAIEKAKSEGNCFVVVRPSRERIEEPRNEA